MSIITPTIHFSLQNRPETPSKSILASDGANISVKKARNTDTSIDRIYRNDQKSFIQDDTYNLSDHITYQKIDTKYLEGIKTLNLQGNRTYTSDSGNGNECLLINIPNNGKGCLATNYKFSVTLWINIDGTYYFMIITYDNTNPYTDATDNDSHVYTVFDNNTWTRNANLEISGGGKKLTSQNFSYDKGFAILSARLYKYTYDEDSKKSKYEDITFLDEYGEPIPIPPDGASRITPFLTKLPIGTMYDIGNNSNRSQDGIYISLDSYLINSNVITWTRGKVKYITDVKVFIRNDDEHVGEENDIFSDVFPDDIDPTSQADIISRRLFNLNRAHPKEPTYGFRDITSDKNFKVGVGGSSFNENLMIFKTDTEINTTTGAVEKNSTPTVFEHANLELNKLFIRDTDNDVKELKVEGGKLMYQNKNVVVESEVSSNTAVFLM